jgi:NADPH-dependent curcumin reductase CurA
MLDRVQEQASAATHAVTHAAGAVSNAVIQTAKAIMPKSLQP